MPTAQHSTRGPFDVHIAEAAERFGLPQSWIRAVMRAESANDPRSTSHKGAIGLMQLMPRTWADLRIRYQLGSDPYDPHDNILAGAAYLRELHDRYGTPGFLAAYNAGPGRYEEHLGGRPLPAETRAYVAALAPAIGVEVEPYRLAAAGLDPMAWRRSPIFVRQGTDGSIAPAVQTESSLGAPSNDRPVGPPAVGSVRDVSAIASHPGGLFVARAEPDSAQ